MPSLQCFLIRDPYVSEYDDIDIRGLIGISIILMVVAIQSVVVDNGGGGR